MTGNPAPPLLATLLLRSLLPRRARTSVVADLEEEYRGRTKLGCSRLKNRMWYWKEAVSLISWYLVDAVCRGRSRSGTPPTNRKRSVPYPIGRRSFDSLWQDLRHGLRSLARNPGLFSVAALSIALGIGATTTVFSFVNTVFFRPLSGLGIEGVVSIHESRSGLGQYTQLGLLIPYNRYLKYREATKDVFLSLTAHRVDGFAVRLSDATIRVRGALTSGNYFQTVGVRPALGRVYATDDAAEVVISHRLWISSFGADSSVLGKTIVLDGRTVTVVGVAPDGFYGASLSADALWTPVGNRGVDADSWAVQMIPFGRVRPNLSLEQADAAVQAVALRIPAEYSEVTVQSARLKPVSRRPLAEQEEVVVFLAVLMGMASLVLLTASANIGGVMLARGFARRQEMAVRQALGAGRARLVRFLLMESSLIFVIGGTAGVLMAYWTTAWVARTHIPSGSTTFLVLTPDTRVLTFAIALTGLAALVSSLIPSVKASRSELVAGLKIGGAGTIGTGSRMRQIFVGGQVAVAVTLLLSGVLFARSLREGLRVDLGFDPDGLVLATVDLGPPLDYDQQQGRLFQSTLLERIRAFPGVKHAALSQHAVFGQSRSGAMYSRPDKPDMPSIYSAGCIVSAGFLEAMGINKLSGRFFSEGDVEGATPVMVINQTLADRLFPGENPIGQRVRGPSGMPHYIIGVTQTGRYHSAAERPTAFAYLPYNQRYSDHMVLHVRAPGAEAVTNQRLVDEVRRLDPNVALGSPTLITEIVGSELSPQRLGTQLIGAFGLVGLLLAATGVYGVLAYHMTLRTREFALRQALGATQNNLVLSVVIRGAFIAGVGCVLGVVAGGALANAMRSLLIGVRPLDPVTFVIVPALLFVVALFASYLPARRANGVDATEALRIEA